MYFLDGIVHGCVNRHIRVAYRAVPFRTSEDKTINSRVFAGDARCCCSGDISAPTTSVDIIYHGTAWYVYFGSITATVYPADCPAFDDYFRVPASSTRIPSSGSSIYGFIDGSAFDGYFG